jgi:hypothetical protein
MAPGPVTYPGSAALRQKQADLQDKQTYVEGLPDSNPLKARWKMELDAEAHDLKVPTGFTAKEAGTETTPVYRQNARTGSIEKVGEVPKGSHFMTEPPPKDNTAHELAKSTQLERVRDTSLKEWNDKVKPIEEQITRLNKLSDTLDQNSNVADATIAGQIIATIEGGRNSGVRVTDTAINQIMKNSRTRPEDMQMVLQKWGVASPEDQANGVFFDKEQKKGLRELVRTFRKQAHEAHDKALTWRRKLDSATDIDSIRKTGTDAVEDLFAEPAAPAAAASAPKRTRFDMEGRVIP